MEDLTKQQIVLVTLLVSFVTSIATGIVTVSLMEQAPKAMTQTINHVVEHTIERVVPAENQAAAVVTKETVVVSTEDQVVKAVAKNTAKVVKIRVFKYGVAESLYLAQGLIVSADGLVITDMSVADPNATYEAVLSDGTRLPLQYKKDTDAGISLFKIQIPEDKKKTVTLSPAVFADSDSLKLGQNVIALSGKDSTSVSIGIIQNLDATTSTSTKNKYQKIATTIEAGQSLLGSPLLNLNGEVVGIKTAGLVTENANQFLPVNIFKAIIASENASSTSSI